jgi:EAL domain-containing protein (putative c-di-GMP-specific phosphodiesterase class I)
MLALEQKRGRDIHLAVNLSGASMSDPSICEFIERAIGGLPDPSGMIIEVTETAAITDLERAKEFATRMARIGCRFALDDFGAGYGSFYYFKHLPFDYLKIDGAFVGGLLTQHADEVLVRSLVQVARELGKKTVAEFVEDAQTLEKVRELGVDYAQGFHVGRPGAMPAVARPTADGRHSAV